MKTLIALTVMIASLNAFSSSIQIFETKEASTNEVLGTFKVNEEMGRAWVELAISNSYDVESSSATFERVKVPGLTLVGESVVLDVDGKQVECAQVKTAKIFKRRYAKATGNCTFKASMEKVTVDDGYETYKAWVLKVFLETK